MKGSKVDFSDYFISFLLLQIFFRNCPLLSSQRRRKEASMSKFLKLGIAMMLAVMMGTTLF
ncbi:MAG TPA: hypothetical protein VFN35_09070, partial [Ktedonobacteraceae bacterium]|nr:hypothetical protein [Ktedonobacteraceae bacterium]